MKEGVVIAVLRDPLAAEKGPEWRADPFQRGNPTHTKL